MSKRSTAFDYVAFSVEMFCLVVVLGVVFNSGLVEKVAHGVSHLLTTSIERMK